MALSASAEPTDADRLFTLKIKPLFSEKCNGCHGDDPEDIKGDFDMLSRAKFLAGGDAFESDVLVPGNAAKSFFMEAIKWEDPDYEMPPKENDRLTAEQIALVEKWINDGAVWPNEETQAAVIAEERKRVVTKDGMLVNNSGGLGDEWTYRRYQPEDIWAFQPLQKPALPNLDHQNPIDALIGEKLTKAGFKPAPKADAKTLVRRATYDLTGLPPTPREVHEFRLAHKQDPEKAWTEFDRPPPCEQALWRALGTALA